MTMRMLIDARHQEETRVAVVKGNRIEEFDFESAERKQLKGNIYLAKVTRVEPSLQAAFIEFGGNRHGFLAFSEIHPDYYQIPKEDRDALLREEAEHHAEEEALRRREDGDDEHDHDEPEGSAADEGDADLDDADLDDADLDDEPREAMAEDAAFDAEAIERSDTDEDHAADEHDHDDHGQEALADDEHAAVDAPPKPSSNNGGEGDAVEALRKRRMNLRRRYKIQDVIRRRQVLLVQVVKEERGNKGAALTTYLSLAGRYCVLMPNTAHGGGISRKISNGADRKRLKSIMADLQLPSTMGCIVRTAGLQRTKVEIRRDFDYLARLWDGIRERTLHSSAPALIHEDSDLIKRAIRDIYNRDIDEVIVEGEGGYRAAREFMKLLMPSHAKKVQLYVDAIPLFQRAGVEDQLNAMYQPVVQLKSGGYLVINPTEALVSIDINSGRSTREHNIEQTATATNLEASYEIARQLRLRDMAGLVVIDFIDMENNSNIRKVEKALKDALKDDRARIQVGRISSFGLMEMSRQRLRTGVLEASTRQCPHCEGTGLVRTASSAGLSALRMLEEEAARGRGSRICLRASQEAAIYVLNRKRGELAEIEDRYGVLIEIVPDGAMEGARMAVESGGPPPAHAPKLPPPPLMEADDDEPILDEDYDEEASADEEETTAQPRGESGEGGEAGARRKRRRRRRGGRRDEGGVEGQAEAASDDMEGEHAERAEDQAEGDEQPASAEAGDGEQRRGRRGRRGGRRRGGGGGGDRAASVEQLAEESGATEPAELAPATDAGETLADLPDQAPVAEAEPAAAPRPRARRRPRARTEELPLEIAGEPDVPVAPTDEPEPDTVPEVAAKPARSRRKAAEPTVEGEAKPARRGRAKAAAEQAAEPAALAGTVAEEEADLPEAAVASDEADGGDVPRRGWWQRTFGN